MDKIVDPHIAEILCQLAMSEKFTQGLGLRLEQDKRWEGELQQLLSRKDKEISSLLLENQRLREQLQHLSEQNSMNRD